MAPAVAYDRQLQGLGASTLLGCISGFCGGVCVEAITVLPASPHNTLPCIFCHTFSHFIVECLNLDLLAGWLAGLAIYLMYTTQLPSLLCVWSLCIFTTEHLILSLHFFRLVYFYVVGRSPCTDVVTSSPHTPHTPCRPSRILSWCKLMDSILIFSDVEVCGCFVSLFTTLMNPQGNQWRRC